MSQEQLSGGSLVTHIWNNSGITFALVYEIFSVLNHLRRRENKKKLKMSLTDFLVNYSVWICVGIEWLEISFNKFRRMTIKDWRPTSSFVSYVSV